MIFFSNTQISNVILLKLSVVQVRSSLIDLQKAKTFNDKLQLGKTIVTHVFTPDLPAVTEYTTGETMGASADRLAAAFSVSRA